MIKVTPGVTTLKDLSTQVEGIYPFISLNVGDEDNNLILSTTVSNARFRSYAGSDKMVEIRNSDSMSVTPVMAFVAKDMLDKYILGEYQDNIRYVFYCKMRNPPVRKKPKIKPTGIVIHKNFGGKADE